MIHCWRAEDNFFVWREWNNVWGLSEMIGWVWKSFLLTINRICVHVVIDWNLKIQQNKSAMCSHRKIIFNSSGCYATSSTACCRPCSCVACKKIKFLLFVLGTLIKPAWRNLSRYFAFVHRAIKKLFSNKSTGSLSEPMTNSSSRWTTLLLIHWDNLFRLKFYEIARSCFRSSLQSKYFSRWERSELVLRNYLSCDVQRRGKNIN